MLSVCDLNKLLSCDHIYHMNLMICHLNFYPLLLCNNVATVASVRIRASHISGILGTQREKEYESATLVSFLAHMFLYIYILELLLFFVGVFFLNQYFPVESITIHFGKGF